jgi:hypothetical protein
MASDKRLRQVAAQSAAVARQRNRSVDCLLCGEAQCMAEGSLDGRWWPFSVPGSLMPCDDWRFDLPQGQFTSLELHVATPRDFGASGRR